MDHDPVNEESSGHRADARPTPPPPPPPPPPGGFGGYYYPYGPPPAAVRKTTSIWRIFSILVLLCLIGFLVLLVLGSLGSTALGKRIALLRLGGDKVGLVRIEGIISQSEDKQFWIDSLRELGKSPRIKGIVVRIDSPGGTVGASQELYAAILDIRQKMRKPVYVSMGDLAASGGYYTASAAERIYANKGTLTGSIGVIFSKPQIGELTQKLGIQTEVVKSGRFKDAGDLMRPMTPEERALFDTLIANTYNQFVDDVLTQRKEALGKALTKFPAGQWAAYTFTPPPGGKPTTEDFLRQAADGRVYTGQQALQLGLIDEIGSLQDTIAAMGRKIGLGTDPGVTEMTRRRGIGELFKSQVGDLLPSGRSPLQYLMKMP